MRRISNSTEPQRRHKCIYLVESRGTEQGESRFIHVDEEGVLKRGAIAKKDIQDKLKTLFVTDNVNAIQYGVEDLDLLMLEKCNMAECAFQERNAFVGRQTPVAQRMPEPGWKHELEESIGVAAFLDDGQDGAQLVWQADVVARRFPTMVVQRVCPQEAVHGSV